MTFKKTVTTLSALCALMSTSTYAASPGFYIGAQIGYAKAAYGVNDFSHSPPVMTSAVIDNSGTGGRADVGYQFDDNWAAELGFGTYGKTNFNSIVTSTGTLPNGSVNSQAWDVVGKGIYPADNGVSFFGKLGFALVRAYNTDGMSVYNGMRKTRPTAGVGLSYDFNPNVCADISFARIFKGSNIENTDLTAVGLYYHFG